jgi:FLVCR family MFS transporter 7
MNSILVSKSLDSEPSSPTAPKLTKDEQHTVQNRGNRGLDERQVATAQKTKEEVPGGWTRMRTMKMRALSRKGEGSVRLGSANGSGSGGTGDAYGPSSSDVKVGNGASDGERRSGATLNDKGSGDIEGLTEIRSDEDLLPGQSNIMGAGEGEVHGEEPDIIYKVYKRRWFGLVQLVLLNIIVSWDVSTLSQNQMNEH